MKTKNLGLVKPRETDYYDVEVGNKNLDKLDAVAGTTARNMAQLLPHLPNGMIQPTKRIIVQVLMPEEYEKKFLK